MNEFSGPLMFLLKDGPIEVEARLCEPRITVGLMCGWNSPARIALDNALLDPTQAAAALAEVNRLPVLLRRRVLAVLAAVA
jgi:hypothetical protein